MVVLGQRARSHRTVPEYSHLISRGQPRKCCKATQHWCMGHRHCVVKHRSRYSETPDPSSPPPQPQINAVIPRAAMADSYPGCGALWQVILPLSHSHCGQRRCWYFCLCDPRTHTVMAGDDCVRTALATAGLSLKHTAGLSLKHKACAAGIGRNAAQVHQHCPQTQITAAAQFKLALYHWIAAIPLYSHNHSHIRPPHAALQSTPPPSRAHSTQHAHAPPSWRSLCTRVCGSPAVERLYHWNVTGCR